MKVKNKGWHLCELSAQQTIHMNCQGLLSQKKKKKIRMLASVVVTAQQTIHMKCQGLLSQKEIKNVGFSSCDWHF